MLCTTLGVLKREDVQHRRLIYMENGERRQRGKMESRKELSASQSPGLSFLRGEAVHSTGHSWDTRVRDHLCHSSLSLPLLNSQMPRPKRIIVQSLSQV